MSQNPDRDTKQDSMIGPWRLVDRDRRLAVDSDEGLATLRVPGRQPRLVHRGAASVPPELLVEGRWVHIGDPDALNGVLVDCFQGESNAKDKLFVATLPDGTRRRFVHPLAPGETYHNSFVAISPDGQWMLSGEWDELTRLLVFATPVLNPSAAENLPLRAQLRLDHPVRDVQGAAFVDATTILCSTDDAGTDLWPVSHQLLRVDLPHPLDGRDIEGHVTCLGSLPRESACEGRFEVEGIDYDAVTGDLRVVVTPPYPCGLAEVAVYRYRR